MPCPALRSFLLTEHALFEMARRRISREEVAAALANPEQTEQVRTGRCLYQAPASVGTTLYLLRVFVDLDRDPPEVVTAYRTSKVGKYRRS